MSQFTKYAQRTQQIAQPHKRKGKEALICPSVLTDKNEITAMLDWKRQRNSSLVPVKMRKKDSPEAKWQLHSNKGSNTESADSYSGY